MKHIGHNNSSKKDFGKNKGRIYKNLVQQQSSQNNPNKANICISYPQKHS